MYKIINKILNEIDYKNNPYFVALNDGSFSKEYFCETQIQFYSAVTFFSRPMAALAAKIPNAEMRINIIHNVWEEHGEGELEKSHGYTFKEFLKRLSNINEQDILIREVWPEVVIFNTTLMGACSADDFLVGTAVMGMIELMFSDISYILSQGIIKRGWMNQNNMIHYSLHQELDIKHSQDFFSILENYWDESREKTEQIKQGLYLGATLFNNFYRDLYISRKRRLIKSNELLKSNLIISSDILTNA
jgi:pyrroloquinoline-quinone synthase